MVRPIKNHGKSIRSKLLNLTKSTRHQYMYLLARYFNERLLYRISVSRYRGNFLLKGGSLLYAMEGLDARPTVDIDFMAEHISRDAADLNVVVTEILSISCPEDGVTYDLSTVRTEPIAIDKKYPGTRFWFVAHMDTIEHPMSIDFGFGDIVTPCPVDLDYPLLLDGLPSISVKAYSVETVLAEKFHAMVERDINNSRMKDFFDCYQILLKGEFDYDVLRDAIKATFDNRHLRNNPDLKLFTVDFVNDRARQLRWSSFLRKIKWKQDIPFGVVMDVIRKSFEPLLLEYWSTLK